MLGHVFQLPSERKLAWLKLGKIFITQTRLSRFVSTKQTEGTFFQALVKLESAVVQAISETNMALEQQTAVVAVNQIAILVDASKELIKTTTGALFANKQSPIYHSNPTPSEVKSSNTVIAYLVDASGFTLPTAKTHGEALEALQQEQKETKNGKPFGGPINDKKGQYECQENTKAYMSKIVAWSKAYDLFDGSNNPGELVENKQADGYPKGYDSTRQTTPTPAEFLAALKKLVDADHVVLNSKGCVILMGRTLNRFMGTISKQPEEISSLATPMGTIDAVFNTQLDANSLQDRKSEPLHRKSVLQLEIFKAQTAIAISSLLELCSSAEVLLLNHGDTNGALFLQLLFPAMEDLLTATNNQLLVMKRFSSRLESGNQLASSRFIEITRHLDVLYNTLEQMKTHATQGKKNLAKKLQNLATGNESLSRELERVIQAIDYCKNTYVATGVLNAEGEQQLIAKTRNMKTLVPLARQSDVNMHVVAQQVQSIMANQSTTQVQTAEALEAKVLPQHPEGVDVPRSDLLSALSAETAAKNLADERARDLGVQLAEAKAQVRTLQNRLTIAASRLQGVAQSKSASPATTPARSAPEQEQEQEQELLELDPFEIKEVEAKQDNDNLSVAAIETHAQSAAEAYETLKFDSFSGFWKWLFTGFFGYESTETQTASSSMKTKAEAAINLAKRAIIDALDTGALELKVQTATQMIDAAIVMLQRDENLHGITNAYQAFCQTQLRHLQASKQMLSSINENGPLKLPNLEVGAVADSKTPAANNNTSELLIKALTEYDAARVQALNKANIDGDIVSTSSENSQKLWRKLLIDPEKNTLLKDLTSLLEKVNQEFDVLKNNDITRKRYNLESRLEHLKGSYPDTHNPVLKNFYDYMEKALGNISDKQMQMLHKHNREVVQLRTQQGERVQNSSAPSTPPSSRTGNREILASPVNPSHFSASQSDKKRIEGLGDNKDVTDEALLKEFFLHVAQKYLGVNLSYLKNEANLSQFANQFLTELQNAKRDDGAAKTRASGFVAAFNGQTVSAL